MALKTKAQLLTAIDDLRTKIATLLADNISQDISEADVREVHSDACDILEDMKDSLASVPDDLAPAGAFNGSEQLVFNQGGAEVQDTLKNVRTYTQKSLTDVGTVIRFDSGRKVYGSIAAPEAANITADHTNAVLNTQVLMIHQVGVAPAFSAEFKKTSGAYNTAKLNFIRFTYIDATTILYSIEQY